MNKVTRNFKNKFKYEFYTLVTDFNEYKEMVNSAKIFGFDNDVNFNYFDNTVLNEFDGFDAINYSIKNSQSKYIVVCHQDIVFKFDDREKLDFVLENLDIVDPNWGVAGNAGLNEFGELGICITDPNGYVRQVKKEFPFLVGYLDENFIIINNSKNLACSIDLGGFHFYGLDLCQNANSLGLKCYVIDFHIFHKSIGNVNKAYIDLKKKFINKIQNNKKSKFYYTTTTKFFVSSFKILNLLMNFKNIIINYSVFLLKLIRDMRG